MSRTKITIIGRLRFSEKDGLLFSYSNNSTEALPNWDKWPGLRRGYPTPPSRDEIDSKTRPGNYVERWKEQEIELQAAKKEFERDRNEYLQELHSDQAYRQAAIEFVERQRREPILIRYQTIWVYRDNVLSLDVAVSDGVDELPILIKHFVLRRERQYERVRREVQAFQNIEKLEGTTREPISDSVRLFVWQRDRGQCVKCNSQRRLEFDHIIPVAEGGSSTERNIQLLCETCNRSKGATI